MALVKIKNTSGLEGTWNGQVIDNDDYYEIPEAERNEWIDDSDVFSDVASGNLTINDGVDDITDAALGWKTLTGSIKLPISDIDGKKLAVHPSYKPIGDEKTTYVVWAGAGDDMITGDIGDGEVMEFNMTTGTSYIEKDIKFHPDNGRVWIHEGYLKFEGGGLGDYLCAIFISEATPLQQAVNLDLEVTDNWIKLAAGGPGTGTHGWADPTKIVLIPRGFSEDGDWDYDGTNLTPNTGGTGGYKISDIQREVHEFINHIPCLGSCQTFFSMSSDETAELVENYFIRVCAHNVSDTNWTAACIMEIYRERTAKP